MPLQTHAAPCCQCRATLSHALSITALLPIALQPISTGRQEDGLIAIGNHNSLTEFNFGSVVQPLTSQSDWNVPPH